MLFERAGICDVLINVHAHSERVLSRIARLNSRCSVRWTCSVEPKLLGSAGTLLANRAWLEASEVFLVAYADTVMELPIADFLEAHRASGLPVTLALFKPEDPTTCGVVELDGSRLVVSFEEKPLRPRSPWANAGLCAFNRTLLDEICRPGAFDISHDVLPRLIGQMGGWCWEGYCRDIGTLEALAAAEADGVTGLFRTWPPAVPLEADYHEVIEFSRRLTGR